MDLRAHSFRCFLMLAEEGSFTRAAARVGLTQSALSMRIRDIERQLGVRLFHRSSRSVELTGEGAELLDQARRIVAETDRFDSLAEELRSAPEVPLHVALPVTATGIEIWMALLDRFRALEPKVEVETSRHSAPDLIAAVQSGAADIGFVPGRPGGDLPVVVLARRRLALFVPAEWEIAAKDRLDVEDVAGMRIASFHRAINPGLFDQILAPLGAAGAELVEAPEGIISAGFAARARVASIGFDLTAEASRRANMRPLEILGLDLDLELCVLRSPDTSRRSVRRFWELAKQFGARVGEADRKATPQLP